MRDNCVCGCHITHEPHCTHGCTLIHADDGVEQGGPLGVKHEPYMGVYNGKYSLTPEETAVPPPPAPVYACGGCHIAWNGEPICPSCGKDAA